MSDPFVGQIALFGFPFAPQGWAFCDGRMMSLFQNIALFQVIGNNYGGNGQTTFALPNLQGRAAIGAGQGTGLSTHEPGESGGDAAVKLQTAANAASRARLFGVERRRERDQPAGQPAGPRDAAIRTACGRCAGRRTGCARTGERRGGLLQRQSAQRLDRARREQHRCGRRKPAAQQHAAVISR